MLLIAHRRAVIQCFPQFGSSLCLAGVMGRFVYLYLLWVETIRIRRADGCGPPDRANACNDGYHFDMSMNFKIRPQQSCTNTIHASLGHISTLIQDVNTVFSSDDLNCSR